MSKKLKLAEFEPSIAVCEDPAARGVPSADPTLVLVQCYVTMPGTDDGNGNPLVSPHFVRVSDLLALAGDASKEG
jgi:hypothetical protein